MRLQVWTVQESGKKNDAIKDDIQVSGIGKDVVLLPEKEIQQPRFGCRGFVVHFLKMLAEALSEDVMA